MDSYLSSLRESSQRDDERQPLLGGDSSIEEGQSSPAAQATRRRRPSNDSETSSLPKKRRRVPSISTISTDSQDEQISSPPRATPYIPSQNSSPMSASPQSTISARDAAGHPTSSSETAASNRGFSGHGLNSLPVHEVSLPSSTDQLSPHFSPVEQLGSVMRSSFNGLKQEVQRNHGEVALIRGEVSGLTTQVKQNAMQGEPDEILFA